MLGWSEKLGAYETFRSYRGKFIFLPAHEARLSAACKALGLNIVLDFAKLLPAVGKVDLRVRIDVAGEEIFISDVEALPWWESFLYPDIWKLAYRNYVRPMAFLKHSNTEDKDKLLAEVREEGADEVVFFENGFLREGALSNVWIFSNGCFATSDEGILKGLTREFLINLISELGMKLELRDISFEEFRNAEAVFCTNSVRGLVAVDRPLPESLRVLIEAADRKILKFIENAKF